MSELNWICCLHREEAKLCLASSILGKVKNVLAKKRQPSKAQAKAKKSEANMKNRNDIVDDIINENNAFDIFNDRHYCIFLTSLMLVWYWFHKSIGFIT